MKIEIEHEGSCLGATGGTGQLMVRDASQHILIQWPEKRTTGHAEHPIGNDVWRREFIELVRHRGSLAACDACAAAGGKRQGQATLHANRP